jgi:hypothetical protein
MAFPDRGDAAMLDDERAVPNDAPARIDGDEIIDVADDKAGHLRRGS